VKRKETKKKVIGLKGGDRFGSDPGSDLGEPNRFGRVYKGCKP